MHRQAWPPSSSRLAWGASLESLTKSGGAQASGGSPETARRPATQVQAREAEAESPERLLLRSRDVIEKLPPSFEKARLFSELATTQAELTFHKAARETGRRAVETVLAMDIEEEQNPSMFAQQRTNELREAAKALAAAGDVEAALAAEEKIGVASPVARSHREFVLQEVGEALAKAGFLDEAKRVMQRHATKGTQDRIVEWCLASAQAKAGDVKAALADC